MFLLVCYIESLQQQTLPLYYLIWKSHVCLLSEIRNGTTLLCFKVKAKYLSNMVLLDTIKVTFDMKKIRLLLAP